MSVFIPHPKSFWPRGDIKTKKRIAYFTKHKATLQALVVVMTPFIAMLLVFSCYAHNKVIYNSSLCFIEKCTIEFTF